MASLRTFPALALVVVLGLVTAACDSSNDAADATVDPATADQPTVLQPVGGFVLQAMTDRAYTTSIFTPAIKFSGANGWLFNGEFEPLLLLSRGIGSTGTQQQALNFVRFSTTDTDAVVAALQSEPILVFSEETDPATIGGIEGMALTATAVVPGGGQAQGLIFPNNLFVSQVPLDPPVFFDGDAVRFTVIPVDDVVLVVLAVADAESSFDDHLAAADALLATVTFEG